MVLCRRGAKYAKLRTFVFWHAGQHGTISFPLSSVLNVCFRTRENVKPYNYSTQRCFPTGSLDLEPSRFSLNRTSPIKIRHWRVWAHLVNLHLLECSFNLKLILDQKCSFLPLWGIGRRYRKTVKKDTGWLPHTPLRWPLYRPNFESLGGLKVTRRPGPRH